MEYFNDDFKISAEELAKQEQKLKLISNSNGLDLTRDDVFLQFVLAYKFDAPSGNNQPKNQPGTKHVDPMPGAGR